MTLHIVRHTAVDIAPGICYGQTDVPVKDTFALEAAQVKQRLSVIRPDAVFSSPLSRCVQLAAYCGYAPVPTDHRLKELNFGLWEGKAWDAIDMSVWESDWIHTPAPGGESLMQMYERLASFLDEQREKGFRTVVVFAHGGIIACARTYFRVSDLRQSFRDIPPYGQVATFGGDAVVCKNSCG